MDNYQDYELKSVVNGVEIKIGIKGNLTDYQSVAQSIIQMALGMANAVSRPIIQLPTQPRPSQVIEPAPSVRSDDEYETDEDMEEHEDEMEEDEVDETPILPTQPRHCYNIQPAPSVCSDEDDESEDGYESSEEEGTEYYYYS